MNGADPSPFTPEECLFFERLIRALPEPLDKLLRDDVSMAQVTRRGDFLSVELPGYARPPYVGHKNLPFEGSLRDVRGGAVLLLVNTDQNGRLLELEAIYWESDKPIELDWSTLEIIPEPPLREQPTP